MDPREATLERVRAALGELEHELVESRDDCVSIEVEREALHGALARLRDHAAFETVTFVTGIDRSREIELDPLGSERARFEVVHQLHSIEHADRVRVRTAVAEDDARVPTCTDLWPGASFMERECYDMFGIEFEGHPDLRRLLMPEEYDHHPLRKDFPIHGIEPDRLYREWDRKRREEAEA